MTKEKFINIVIQLEAVIVLAFLIYTIIFQPFHSFLIAAGVYYLWSISRSLDELQESQRKEQ